MIGKIEKVPLRDIWKHEAHDFTKWLQDNIDVLSDVINLPLTNVEREQTTGNFYVDLTAEDNSGKTVIIENQLEKSNHDHLGKSKREKKERYILRKDFWTIVLNKLKDRTNLFNAVSPSESSWLEAGSGKRGIQYTMWVTQEEARLSLYIDRGKDSEEENQSILEKLEQHKNEIESIYGDKFEWHKRDDERACQIIINVSNGGYKSDKEKLDAIGENLAECMTRFEKAFAKYIKDLKI